MPVVFVPHGGGPWPWMDDQREAYRSLTAYLRDLPSVTLRRPDAIVVVSAHWEEPQPTVMAAPAPGMLYDYGGFPPHTYRVTWQAPGAVALAGEIRALLQDAGIAASEDSRRGFDHGAFVPLAVAYPDADIPTLQLSLQAGLDPATHFEIGRALAPLRDRGVFIVGSGMSYHNIRGLMLSMRGDPAPALDAQAFDAWLAETITGPAPQRRTRLLQWECAPAARACHPREEHLIPLHVCAGAADGDVGTLPYRDALFGVPLSAAQFG